MVFASVATVLGVACRHRPMTGRAVQERAMKICPCHHGPRTDSAARAVARWDGNVALQRWGCGRCRRRDGGGGMSGCEVAVPRHVYCLFLSLFSLPPFLSLFHSIFLTKAIRLDRFLVPFFFFCFHLSSCIVTGPARGAGRNGTIRINRRNRELLITMSRSGVFDLVEFESR